MRDDRLCGFAVDVGEPLQIPFGVARRNTTDAGGSPPRPCTIAGDQTFGFTERRVPQIVRVFLRPFQPAFFSVNADAQGVLVARCHLAAPQHPLGPALKTQHHMSVVIHLTPRHKRIQISGKAFDLQPGDKTRQIVRMGADIAR